jgi:predicted nucleotidyltransferase
MTMTADKLDAAVQLLRERGARRVILFGSLTTTPCTAHDVDLAVEGIPLRRLLEADVALQELLQAPTDLISREENPDFFDIIKDYGRTLFQAA